MPRSKQFDEQEVLEKASQLFWRKGYKATSIQDLVDHLGINRGSLYDTFGDKDQLFDRSFALYRKQSADMLADYLASHESVKQGFRNLFNRALDEIKSDKDKKGCMVVNITTELVPGDQRLEKALSSNKANVLKIFKEHIQRGQSSGEIKSKSDPAILANLLYTVYNGMQVVTKVQTDYAEMQKSIDLALSLLDA